MCNWHLHKLFTEKNQFESQILLCKGHSCIVFLLAIEIGYCLDE